MKNHAISALSRNNNAGRNARIFACAFFFGVLACSGGYAAAAFVRTSAAACFASYPSSGWVWAGDLSASQGDSNGWAELDCPVQDDTWHSHGSATNAWLWARNESGSPGFNGYACVKFYNANGATCGTVQSSSTVGNVQMTLDRTAWINNPADFPYVMVNFQVSDATHNWANMVHIYGYSMTY
jgi:hypothetical protein